MQPNSRSQRQHQPSQEKTGDQRDAFEIDRDRVIYSVYFRRLAQVTQVVNANEGSVFHNRLTHSLKVAQIARRLAEKFIKDESYSSLIKKHGLNADVVEAAALAHDLGHPPFGHIAEKELDKLAKNHGLSDGFEGNAQTFRILTLLEPHRLNYPGLNLTRATLDATLKYPWFRARDNGDPHAIKRAKKYSIYDIDREALAFVRKDSETEEPSKQKTLEASIMEFADDVTYSVHDLEDFYLAGLIPLEKLINNEDEFKKLISTFISNVSDDDIKNTLTTPEHQTELKELLNKYKHTKYNPGSREEMAHIKTVSSNLIQEYLNSVYIKEEYGKYGYLERPDKTEINLKFLQQIVWKYVILNPRLATQQYGQKKIIKTLFDVYKEAVKTQEMNLIPNRFLEDNKLLVTKGQESQKVRIAIDIVASFSEMEAILMYRRFTGIDSGSVMDYMI